MKLKPFDILIFRKKTIVQSLYSITTLDLDNHVGIIVSHENKLYLNHFVITNFKYLIYNTLFQTDYKCGKAVLTPIDYIDNDEYYVYRLDCNISKLNIDDEKTAICISKSSELNYLSNFKLLINFLFSKKLFNEEASLSCGHTCISYFFWYLKQHDLFNEDFIDYDFYQKRMDKIKGFKYKYKLIFGHNIGKKDLSKFNPYSLAYYLSFLLNIMVLLFYKVNDKNGLLVSPYILILNLFIFTPFGFICAYYSHLLRGGCGNGRRYIGAVIAYIFFSIIFLDYNLNIDKNKIQYISYLCSCSRIMIIRFASWLCNDIKGVINKATLRPYDIALYESLWEGLIPTLFLLFSYNYLSYKFINQIIFTNYSISRFIIEFYKPKLLNNCILTLGQIDSILNYILMYWYINFDYNNFRKYLFEYSLLVIFYMDVCFRFSVNKFNSENKLGNVLTLKWKTTYNRGFFNGSFKTKSIFFKLLLPIFYLFILNRYFLQNDYSLNYIFNVFALLNVFERLVNRHVTDYLTIYFLSFKTFNLNFSDIVINVMIIYFLLKNFLK
jgi:lipoprotein signal peptidase